MPLTIFTKNGNIVHSSILPDDEIKSSPRWASVLMREEDYMLMEEVFRPAIKRCAKNAESCLTGYGSEGSKMKAEEWDHKGWRMLKPLSKLRKYLGTHKFITLLLMAMVQAIFITYIKDINWIISFPIIYFMGWVMCWIWGLIYDNRSFSMNTKK